MNKAQIPNDEEIKKNLEDFSNALDVLYEKKANKKLKWYNIIESDDHTSVTSSSNKDIIDYSNKETAKIKSKFLFDNHISNVENEMETNFKDLTLKEKSEKIEAPNLKLIDKNKSVRNSDFELMFNDFFSCNKSKIENPFIKKLTKSDLDFNELRKYTREHKNRLFTNEKINDIDHKYKHNSNNFLLSPLPKDNCENRKIESNVKVFQFELISQNSNFKVAPLFSHSPEYNKIMKKTNPEIDKNKESNLNMFLGRTKRFKSD